MTYPGAQRSYPLNDPPPEMMPHDPDKGSSGPPKPTILGLVDGHWWHRKKKVELPHCWHDYEEVRSRCCFCSTERTYRATYPPDPGHGPGVAGSESKWVYEYWCPSRSDVDPAVCWRRR